MPTNADNWNSDVAHINSSYVSHGGVSVQLVIWKFESEPSGTPLTHTNLPSSTSLFWESCRRHAAPCNTLRRGEQEGSHWHALTQQLAGLAELSDTPVVALVLASEAAVLVRSPTEIVQHFLEAEVEVLLSGTRRPTLAEEATAAFRKSPLATDRVYPFPSGDGVMGFVSALLGVLQNLTHGENPQHFWATETLLLAGSGALAVDAGATFFQCLTEVGEELGLTEGEQPTPVNYWTQSHPAILLLDPLAYPAAAPWLLSPPRMVPPAFTLVGEPAEPPRPFERLLPQALGKPSEGADNREDFFPDPELLGQFVGHRAGPTGVDSCGRAHTATGQALDPTRALGLPPNWLSHCSVQSAAASSVLRVSEAISLLSVGTDLAALVFDVTPRLVALHDSGVTRAGRPLLINEAMVAPIDSFLAGLSLQNSTLLRLEDGATAFVENDFYFATPAVGAGGFPTLEAIRLAHARIPSLLQHALPLTLHTAPVLYLQPNGAEGIESHLRNLLGGNLLVLESDAALPLLVQAALKATVLIGHEGQMTAAVFAPSGCTVIEILGGRDEVLTSAWHVAAALDQHYFLSSSSSAVEAIAAALETHPDIRDHVQPITLGEAPSKESTPINPLPFTKPCEHCRENETSVHPLHPDLILERCPPGRFRGQSGECELCAPGTSRKFGPDSACAPCPPGMFASESGAAVCELCPKNTFSPRPGLTRCLQCPAGRAAPLRGQTACTEKDKWLPQVSGEYHVTSTPTPSLTPKLTQILGLRILYPSDTPYTPSGGKLSIIAMLANATSLENTQYRVTWSAQPAVAFVSPENPTTTSLFLLIDDTDLKEQEYTFSAELLHPNGNSLGSVSVRVPINSPPGIGAATALAVSSQSVSAGDTLSLTTTLWTDPDESRGMGTPFTFRFALRSATGEEYPLTESVSASNLTILFPSLPSFLGTNIYFVAYARDNLGAESAGLVSSAVSVTGTPPSEAAALQAVDSITSKSQPTYWDWLAVGSLFTSTSTAAREGVSVKVLARLQEAAAAQQGATGLHKLAAATAAIVINNCPASSGVGEEAIRLIAVLTAAKTDKALTASILAMAAGAAPSVSWDMMSEALDQVLEALIPSVSLGNSVSVSVGQLALSITAVYPSAIAALTANAGISAVTFNSAVASQVSAAANGVVHFTGWGFSAPPSNLGTSGAPITAVNFVSSTSHLKISDLSTPVSIALTLPSAVSPAGQQWDCIYSDARDPTWRPGGIEVQKPSSGSLSYACLTSHFTAFSLQPTLSVLSVAGCYNIGALTAHCATAGTTALTITGLQFGTSGASAMIGTQRCGTVVHVTGKEDTQLLCTNYGSLPGGSSLAVTVTTAAGGSATSDGALVWTAKKPLVTSVSGCTSVDNQTIKDCLVTGTNPVTVTGSGFIGLGCSMLYAGEYQCLNLETVSDTRLICRSLPGEGSSLPVTVTIGAEFSGAGNVTLSYRAYPTVTSLSGCSTSSSATVLSDCANTGVQLTVNGKNFVGKDVAVIIGQSSSGTPGFNCSTLVVSSDGTRITCQISSLTNGQDRSVTVYVDGAYSRESASISFALQCGRSDSGVLCSNRGECSDVTGECACFSSLSDGFWTGDACESCVRGFYSATCNQICPGGVTNPCSGHGRCSDDVTGTGYCSCNSGYAGDLCSIRCPTTTLGAVCGGHGVCDDGREGSGACTCGQSATAGYWKAPYCTECTAGYWGSKCSGACPTSASEVCSGHGSCFDGLTGNGTCKCAKGYAGAACSITCAGGVTSPCNNNGKCSADDGSCTCYSDPVNGFWTGSTCSTCLATYSGAYCTIPCPVANGKVCNGLGQCQDGVCLLCRNAYCGSACDVTGDLCDIYKCPTGRYGDNCAKICPGGVTSPCSGQGTCDGGTQGTGACVCNTGHAGNACQYSCPGGSLTPCSLQGVCSDLNGTCLCNSGYAGSDCSKACPGGASKQCSTHGSCFDGASGNGTCRCEYGWYGSDCSLQCPGGAFTPCGGHGYCSTDGVCTCFDNSTAGHWAGDDCKSCGAKWLGSMCLDSCPTVGGLDCAGHGSCPSGTTVCSCAHSTVDGFWSGTLCSDCDSGYFGSQCLSPCPGGACNPCNGHGICSTGVNGTGSCKCDIQYAGTDCSTCISGFYGSTCTKECPGGASTPCTGHGICAEGLSGGGSCTCWSNSTTGYWSGQSCNTCASAYYGSRCTSRCPSLYNSGVCSGHGTCFNGVNGNGSCACTQGYAGADCSTACPTTTSGVCNRQGTCRDGSSGDASCTCYSSSAAGFWTGLGCTSCQDGYYGTQCINRCPGGGTCSGHGTCSSGTTGTGECTCNTGYAGLDCSLPCPVSSSGAICSAHGTCNALTGSCECYSNATLGFWTGGNCSSCNPAYSGSSCKLLCPVDTLGLVCSGRGTCLNGRCFSCSDGYCGSNCAVIPLQCAGFTCPGFYGANCNTPCPGGSTNPCNGHGVCSDGKDGDGTCTCAYGWAGSSCSIACQGGTATPCNLHGSCDSNDGSCTCAAGYASSTCGIECPRFGSEVCAGSQRGFCFDGAAGNGTCSCLKGYAGVACHLVCPGGTTSPCSGTGTCNQVNGTCTCLSSTTLGFWSGSDCSTCASGWYGTNCTKRCYGTTDAKNCVCSSGYAGEDCSIECAGGASNPCSGHGSCSDGTKGTGLCTCFTGYATSTCAVECQGGASTPCNNNGICSAATGQCTCYDEDTKGHWTGNACNSCKGKYYGISCNLLCPENATGSACSGHGTCPSNSAVCSCLSGAASGYWSGTTCAECRSGYYGSDCKQSCPGGACAPCTSHGVCSAGINGTGKCSCVQRTADGWFSGDACDNCLTGYFGVTCLRECPGGAANPCNSHGQCDMGITGAGSCTCYKNATVGYWTGNECSSCLSGYYGRQCDLTCLGLVGGVGCSGHGLCSDGQIGTGTCACTPGWATSNCSVECPKSPAGTYCSGHGTCSDGATGNGLCTCTTEAGFGMWTGTRCSLCISGYYGANCSSICPGGVKDQCSGHGSCSNGTSGTGKCACDFGYTGNDCSLTCPGFSSVTNSVCNSHGTCLTDGTCLCATSSTYGFWSGDQCQDCLLGFSGRSCDKACPLHPTTQMPCSGAGTCVDGKCIACKDGTCGTACEKQGSDCAGFTCADGFFGPNCNKTCPGGSGSAACSGKGTCDDGPTGSGTCTCSTGYAGTSCQILCPGGASNPCSLRGTCNATSGSCICESGFAGNACSISCPSVLGLVCAGNGVCSDGSTGNGSCTCKSGYGGISCEKQCPGGATCNGHGTCDSNGTCQCVGSTSVGFWSGSDCLSCVQTYYGSDCRSRCRNGVTVGTACVCSSGWAGLACSRECPGGSGNICNKHGSCFDGNAGNASCSCEIGYVSNDCSIPCQPSPSNPCNSHGTCLSDGTCKCYSDSNTGYWTGKTCSVCQTDWYGSHCDLACPKFNGLTCGAHGTCDSVSVTCQCFQNSTNGFWDGKDCSVCSEFYYGTSCQNVCPGGDCNPCNGHGICSDGLTGTGKCTCQSTSVVGFWTGDACDQCLPGYFGFQCSKQCPGGSATPCFGKGTCVDGRFGSGQCRCSQAGGAGFWGGDCSDCMDGYYGFSCSYLCPGLGATTTACNGHGLCGDKRNGTGKCTCFTGYAGKDCSIACPTVNGLICNSVGTCDSGATGFGNCTCPSDSVSGYWTGQDCSKCKTGYAGSYCLQLCPGGLQNTCSGHGSCDDGVQGNGSCKCTYGYAGYNCEITCLGGSRNPCSGRGSCNAADGSCACYGDSEFGYWTGSLCDQCLTGWSGPGCKTPCPRDLQNRPCGGVGVCKDGVCFDCGGGMCGPVCNLTGDACNIYRCDAGLYGPDCDKKCPNVANVVCAGHGTCSQGKLGTGKCSCNSGWWGTACSNECDGGATSPCSGQGICDPSDEGHCICLSNFAGNTCATPCPGGAGNACNNRGSCFDGRTGNGSCACDLGYAGASCELTCPGVNNTCYGHGVCNKIDASCSCIGSTLTGYWGGNDCTQCLSGWQGDTCKEICVHGTSQNHSCICLYGWAAHTCSIACPGVSSGALCSGHGTCDQGNNGTGTCTCDPNYYTKDCSVRCVASECFPLEEGEKKIRSFAQCNITTGLCECQDNTTGHFQGAKCDTCKDFWWGADCSKACDCNLRGTCDRYTGECACFQSEATGYWSGTDCSSCLSGYVGTQCKEKNSRITSSNPTLPFSLDMDKPPSSGITLIDSQKGIMYLGSQPLVLLNASTMAKLTTLDLGGTATGSVLTNWAIIVSVTLDSGDRAVATLIRGTINPVKYSITKTKTAAVLRAMSRARGEYESKPEFHTLSTTASSTKAVSLVVPMASSNSDPSRVMAIVSSDASTRSVALMDFSDYSLLDFTDITDTVASLSSATYVDGNLILGGQAIDGSTWALLQYIPPSGGDAAQVIELQSDPLVQDVCGGELKCRSVDIITVSNSSIFALVHTSRDYIMLKYLRSNLHLLAAEISVTFTSTDTVSATVLAVDEVANVGYFCLNKKASPSVMYKFNLTTARIFGQQTFTVVAEEPQIILSMCIDSDTRTLYAFPATSSLSMITINLYAVSNVYPTLSDTRGGTVVTVSGEGFINLDDTECKFGDIVVPATSNVGGIVVCTAPAQKEGEDNSCVGQSVEVSLSNSRFSDNRIALRRIPTPTINEVLPNSGSLAGGQTITIKGSGFVDSMASTVRFGWNWDGETPKSWVAVRNVTYLSSFEVLVHQPATTGPTTIPAYLDIALDGQVYSQSHVVYDIIGGARAIAVEPQSSTVRSAALVHLPVLNVSIRDEADHPLLRLDTLVRSVSVSVENTSLTDSTSTNAGNVSLQGILQVASTQGMAYFTDLHLALPPAGTLTLLFTELGTNWKTTALVTITEGSPASLQFLIQPASVTDNSSPLPAQPKVILLDIAGNRVRTLDGTTIVLRGRFIPEGADGTRTEVVSSTTAEISFSSLLLVAKHGITYRLNVTADQLALTPAISTPIFRSLCSRSEYARQYATDCVSCPSHATCNGSMILLVDDNYWRATNVSLTVYSCGSSSKTRCIGSTVTGTCKVNFQGPACQVCASGYGGTSCNACPKNQSSNALYIIGYAVAVIVVLGIFVSMQMRKTSTKKGALPILSKLLVSHLQVSSRLGQFVREFPPLLTKFWVIQEASSQIEVSLASVDCLAGSPATYMKLLGYLFIPLAIFPLSLLMPAIVYQIRLARALRGEYLTYDRSLLQIYVLTVVVALYIIYPTIIQKCATMLQCTSFDYSSVPGYPSVHRFLKVDYSINCADSEYLRWRAVALFFMIGYGVGTPVSFVALVRIIRRWKGEPYADKMFAFMVAGFTNARWFWESTIMLRKMLIVFIVCFIQDAQLQTYIGMWTMTVALVLHVFARPYQEAIYNHLEAFSLAVITCTLNLGLLYFWPIFWDYGQAPSYLLTITIFMMHIAAVGLFAILLLQEIRKKIKEVMASRKSSMQEVKTDKYLSAAAGGEPDSDLDLSFQEKLAYKPDSPGAYSLSEMGEPVHVDCGPAEDEQSFSVHKSWAAPPPLLQMAIQTQKTNDKPETEMKKKVALPPQLPQLALEKITPAPQPLMKPGFPQEALDTDEPLVGKMDDAKKISPLLPHARSKADSLAVDFLLPPEKKLENPSPFTTVAMTPAFAPFTPFADEFQFNFPGGQSRAQSLATVALPPDQRYQSRPSSASDSVADPAAVAVPSSARSLGSFNSAPPKPQPSTPPRVTEEELPQLPPCPPPQPTIALVDELRKLKPVAKQRPSVAAKPVAKLAAPALTPVQLQGVALPTTAAITDEEEAPVSVPVMGLPVAPPSPAQLSTLQLPKVGRQRAVSLQSHRVAPETTPITPAPVVRPAWNTDEVLFDSPQSETKRPDEGMPGSSIPPDVPSARRVSQTPEKASKPLLTVPMSQRPSLAETEVLQLGPEAASSASLPFPPRNMERDSITVLRDYTNHSNRSMYQYYCKQYNVRENKYFSQSLPTTLGVLDLTELTILPTILLGSRGLLPVLEVLRANTQIQSFSISGSALRNTSVAWVVEAVAAHPSLTSIDLSDNHLTAYGADLLTELVHRNPRIRHIDVSNCGLDAELVEGLLAALRLNFDAL
eukprot:TRINITY_DN3729_c0_g1_i6.p1 TRINITY_DN3729_c0_g1~~TRINITY_DN3729_c0_g1_i6.p1  ORF type:complete len:6116 (-),score=439.75 TRINITY_DN3729_c0_g1_i6:64-18258(-)